MSMLMFFYTVDYIRYVESFRSHTHLIHSLFESLIIVSRLLLSHSFIAVSSNPLRLLHKPYAIISKSRPSDVEEHQSPCAVLQRWRWRLRPA